jgi:hypothetical protein
MAINRPLKSSNEFSKKKNQNQNQTQDSTNFHLEFEGMLEYIRSSRIQVTVEDYHLPTVEDCDLTTIEDYHLITVENCDLTTVEVYHIIRVEDYHLIRVKDYLYYLILL